MSNTFPVGLGPDSFFITDVNHNGTYDPEDEILSWNSDRAFIHLAKGHGFDVTLKSYDLAHLSNSLTWHYIRRYAEAGNVLLVEKGLLQVEKVAAEHGLEFDAQKAADLLQLSMERCLESLPSKLARIAEDLCNNRSWFPTLRENVRSASEFLGVRFDLKDWNKTEKILSEIECPDPNARGF